MDRNILKNKRKSIQLKLLIIFNPKAAHGRSAMRLDQVREQFESLDIEVNIEITLHPGHATELVGNSRLTPYDGVIAAGGDGTLFEVLNGLYRHPEKDRVPLGLLPMGTGNAFSRELQVDTDGSLSAIDMIKRARLRKIDVAKVSSADSGFYFLNIMHLGFSVAAGLSARRLKILGKSAYTLATLWQVMKMKSYPLTIEVDGESMTVDNIFTSIANTRYTGTHFLIAPEAKIDDGMLDLVMLRKLSRLRVLKLFPTIYEGRHIEHEEISCLKARRIRLISPAGMLLGPDGEFCGTTPAEVTCLKQDLTVFC
jgi:YegS/Rv2252/BmrU family lipid kinase